MAVLSPGQEAFLLALAARITPETASLDEAQRRRFLELVDEALAARPESIQRQFKLFLTGLRWCTLPLRLRPLDALSGADQDAFLRRFENAPVALLRKGFWGLKAMVFLGYYGRPEAAESLGYQPGKQGNEVLRERARV